MRQTLGLGLASASALILEIALSRLLSTLYFPPYVFGVLAVAIFGIGIGAALSTWQSHLRDAVWLPFYAIAAAATTLLAVGYAVLVVAAPFNAALFVFVALPYVAFGLIVSTLFSESPDLSTRLYMVDLIGAGLGVLLTIPLLNAVGAVNGAAIAAAGFTVSATLFAVSFRNLFFWIYTITVIVIVVSNIALGWLDVDLSRSSANKPLTTSLQNGGTILESRWDAFARTDLVAPSDGGPYQIYVDGAAGSVMPPQDAFNFLINDIGFYPFATSQPAQVMVIGPGGGLDVWFALQANAQEIVAVEVNPASVDLVRDYADYNGAIYSASNLEIRVDEGRSALRRDNRLYDLIYLSQVITETSERSGFALTDNTVYTVEAFRDYLDHLTPGGQLALKLYDSATLTRALSVALAALREDDMTDAEALQHIMAFVDPDETPPVPLLMVQKSPFTTEDTLSYGAVAREVGFTPLFLPGAFSQPPLDAVASGESPYAEVIAGSEVNITPPTDNRPYFFQFERGIPTNLRAVVVFAAVVTLSGLVFWAASARRLPSGLVRWSPLYFAGLGIGFIGIEIAVIQKTSLFLGHPTLAVTTVLATFLLGGGVGSRIVGDSVNTDQKRLSSIPATSVIVVIGVWLLLWQLYSPNLIGADTLVRVGFAVGALLPLTLVMGVPFPVGLQALQDADSRYIALAWAVNGVATVVGSIAALVISIVFGFNAVLVVGVVAYGMAIAAALLTTLER